MEFQLPIKIDVPDCQINYRDRILLMGSCFTEHIGDSLEELKFTVLQNPNGILFDPFSVCRSLISYIQNQKYSGSDLFELNEIWHSWHHHSRFSNINKNDAVQNINGSQQEAHDFLKQADWIIITLGSAFSYQLTTEAIKTELSSSKTSSESFRVANCHRAPAQWFNKHLLDIDEIIEMLVDCCHQLTQFNPNLRIIFTVSPVRHIRDGVVENNRSKARLLEAVHHLVDKSDKLYYFPAYELVIDVLRDYRFYDIDLVHPNYMATEFVLEKFKENYINENSRQLMDEIKKVVIAKKHKPFQPFTKSHQQFLSTHLEKTKILQDKYPFLNLKEELIYFAGT